MNDFDRLELSTETLRELSRDEMAQVAGGTVGAISRTCLIISPVFTAVATYVADQVAQQASVGCA